MLPYILGAILLIALLVLFRHTSRKRAESQRQEMNRAVFRGESELFQRVMVRSLEELAGMPGDFEIGPDNLPTYRSSSGWGAFRVYRSRNGHAYHRTPDCSSPYSGYPLHIWTAYDQGLVPCSRCNPPRPDLSWYRNYLVLYELAQKYKPLLPTYPGPSSDYLRAAEAEEVVEKLRKQLSTVEDQLHRYESLNIEDEIRSAANQQVNLKTRETMHRGLFKSTLVSYDFHSRLPIDTNARLIRAQQEEAEIVPPLQITARIQGKGATYTTTLNDCSCPDFQRNKEPCKHMYRLALEMGLLLSIPADDIKAAMKRLSAAHSRNQKELERIRKGSRK